VFFYTVSILSSLYGAVLSKSSPTP
jgi:hypothetical protein